MAVNSVSSTASTGTLNAPGIGSGLDIQGLVSKLMAVEQQPLTLLNTQEASFQARLSNLGSISGALSSLQSAANALTSASSVKNSALTGDASVLSSTATGDALKGTYSVTVNNLAQGQKLLAAGKDSTTLTIGGGADTTLTFSYGTIAGTPDPVTGIYTNASFTANSAKTTVSVTINSGNNTLAGMRDAINAAHAGVTASIINDGGASPYRLAISANDTGVANSLKIAVSGDSAIASLLAYDPTATQNLQQTQAARNADLSIDGVSITSASNTVTGAIQGVTLNLAKVTAANNPVSVTVQPDTNSLNVALGALVKAYNSAHTSIATATAKGAVLQGDSAVLLVQRQIIAILGGAQPTGGAYTTLSSLGVSFNKDGTLTLATAKISTALTTDFAGVATLTAAIGKTINDTVGNLIGTAGPLSSETNGIQRSIKDIGSRRIDLQKRYDDTQARYQKQFTALDVALSSMNQTSTFLTTQLSSLTNLNKQISGG